VPHIKEWCPSPGTLETIAITRLEDGSTFNRQIPAGYIFHLHWIMQEAFSKEGPKKPRGNRSDWLLAVLDAFVEEVAITESTPDWRSKVLTPVLVRAVNKVDDFNERAINKTAKDCCQLSGSMTVVHWEGFYFNQDMLAPGHHLWWLMAKQVEPESRPDEEVEDTSPDLHEGSVLSSHHSNVAVDAHNDTLIMV